MARRFLVILVSFAILVALAGPAPAQPAELEMTLVGQPIWHTPGDPLGLRIRLSNTGTTAVEGFIVTVAAHGRVLSRSELHESFAGPATVELSRIPAIDASDETIAPGDRLEREIDQPVGALQSLADTTESGVYPLEISVFDESGVVLATTSTQLIYYPTPPEFRLPAVPLVAIAGVPHRGPEGSFAPDDERSPLEDAVQPGGWLSALLDALDRATTPPPPPPEPDRRDRGRGRREARERRRPPPEPQPEPLQLGLVLMPRLAEELVDMSDGYRRDGEDDEEGQVGPASPGATGARAALDSIRGIAERPSVQPILAPYAFPDLPTLFEAFPEPSTTATKHLGKHLDNGEAVLERVLEDPPKRSWIYSPGGRLSHVPLEELQQLDAARFTFFAEESLEPRTDPAGGGCPEAPLSFTCPIAVTTSIDTSTGYALDSAIQERVGDIAAADADRSALQRLFAETAMIREEVPSRTDRVVAIALPTAWEPPPAMTRLLFSGLREAPWLRTFTPRDGLSSFAEHGKPIDRRIRFAAPPLFNEPDAGYIEQIADADSILESFRRVQPPPTLVERLTRNMLASESRVWWTDSTLRLEGERYAEEAANEAQRELDKITIGPTDEIALTSRQAEIPVVVFNDAEYDVSVTVRISSTDLRLDETFPITVQARGLRQLSVDVAAQTSGIFTVNVTVETPNGRFIDGNSVQVRSTEFNEIALGLTFGALAFLVLFYITRAIRTRRAPEEGHGT